MANYDPKNLEHTFQLQLVMPPIHDFAMHLVQQVIPKNPEGFTVSALTWREPPLGDHIYLSGMLGFERCFTKLPTYRPVLRWLKRIEPYLNDPDKFVGGWYSKERRAYCLDLAVACLHRLGAEQLAVASRQESFYHPATRQVIPVNAAQWYAKLGLRAA
jgi:hypothetical protein